MLALLIGCGSSKRIAPADELGRPFLCAVGLYGLDVNRRVAFAQVYAFGIHLVDDCESPPRWVWVR
jgi:hypothetical protein